jgi:alkanesulfonate monooxygenase
VGAERGEHADEKLGEVEDYKIAPHLWSGITTVRPGAGVAVVGNPEQVRDTLQQFIDVGCTDFCLSGYPHDEEAERFGRMVMPRFEHELRAVACGLRRHFSPSRISRIRVAREWGL